MPSKKKKYNARFPAGRIKKIMQTDEEIGKVAQAVPVIISRTLELFVESLLKRAMQITSAKNAKTLTPTHMKQCILSENRFDFLKDLVKNIPDISSTDEDFGLSSGNVSPATPLSAKGFSGYSSFQFQQTSDSSSSKSSGAASHSSVVPQTSQPRFYKEIPIGVEENENRSTENTSSVTCGTTVIQHTGSHLPSQSPSFPPNSKEANPPPSLLRTITGRNITQLNELKLSNCIKLSDNAKGNSEKVNEEESEDEDDDEESEENGFHIDTNIAKTCTIDEDYDS